MDNVASDTESDTDSDDEQQVVEQIPPPQLPPPLPPPPPPQQPLPQQPLRLPPVHPPQPGRPVDENVVALRGRGLQMHVSNSLQQNNPARTGQRLFASSAANGQ